MAAGRPPRKRQSGQLVREGTVAVGCYVLLLKAQRDSVGILDLDPLKPMSWKLCVSREVIPCCICIFSQTLPLGHELLLDSARPGNASHFPAFCPASPKLLDETY